MRWCALVLVCAVIVKVNSEPEPKKYKPNETEKDKKPEPSLTDDEKKFLREVEEKFGVKTGVPSESANNSTELKITSTNSTQKTPLPAVIAIEIVNDTESNTKGKRTIDANLGYGYRTNNGYTYTYFGKPTQEKGKFMIYPYSQHDVSSQHNGHGDSYLQQSDKQSHGTSVEIQPSQAFELVSVKDNENYDDNTRPVDSSHTYVKDTPATRPSTLYTTYNGEGLSGLSGQFPSLMSNYFVPQKQLLTNPQYQDIGLTQDHLSTNGLDQNRPVVPVIVLRIPSSYLKNPTAELYANLPNNYPLSKYLNNVNIQDLVNDYFKKNGYKFAPQLMTYQNSHASNSAITTTDISSEIQQPQQYSNPHVQPSYTQADYSGVQYSAVKPVMAKYPSSFTRQKYLSPQIQSQYRKPIQQQKFEYQYQNVPQSAAYTQANYGQPLYQNQHQPSVPSYAQQNEHVAVAKETTDTASNTEYRSPQYSTSHGTKFVTVDYEGNIPSEISPQVTDNSNNENPQYDFSKESQAGYSSQETLSQGYSSQLQSDYRSSQLANEYYLQKQPLSKESINAYPSHVTNSEQRQQSYPNSIAPQGYDYTKPGEESERNTLVISENYPSKDHTIATILPFSYKQAKNSNTVTVQTVSYVTPEPLSASYLSHFKVMVPQTVLKSHDSEKVTYVNSRPMHYTKAGYYNQDYNPEEEYTVGTHSITQIGKQKPSSYPRNYHTYPKRMTRPGSKTEVSAISSSLNKKHNGKNKSSQ